MRKVLLRVVTAAVILTLGSTGVFAAGPGDGRYFVDADSDGICDNAGSRCAYADADGDGICDLCSADHSACLTGEGAAFVDADGDGVCDNYVFGRGRGTGCGARGGHRNGFRGRCGR